LKASVGFGGSCFQKDVLNLVYIAETLGLTQVAAYWQTVVDMNNFQRERFARDIVHTMFDSLLNKSLAVYGFAFKADTGDTRESSAIHVCTLLLDEGALLNVYDPKVTTDQIFFELNHLNPKITHELFDKRVHTFEDPYECAVGTHALIVLTEWAEFKTYDYRKIYDSMMKPAFVFDGRNLLDRTVLRGIGFCTHGIGVVPDQLDG
jgi:UDPglucose 6-dehydrogenase